MTNATPNDGETKAKIFISYSRKDMAFADRLDAALKARGYEPLIDRTKIYAFEDWWQRIEALITQADTIIFVLSPDAVSSDICAKEVAFAASLHKRFAPVVWKRVDRTPVPVPLQRLNYIFCDDDTNFEASMDQLAEALSTDIAWIRKHTEFGALAQRWSTADRRRGLLLRSPVLEEAERWIESRPQGAPEPSPMTRSFITDSRRAAKQRRVRTIVGLIGITFVVGLGATGWHEREYLKLRWDLWRNVLSTAVEPSLKPKQKFQECSVCPVMVVVPAGEFMMGSHWKEKDRENNEGPQHKVTIAKPFAVSRFEVTFDEWDACVAFGSCGQASDSSWGRGNRPVISLTWDDAKNYVAWLSKLTGKSYRLLTEAEWEYAASAGGTTAYSWGDDIGKGNANCDGCGSQWDSKQTAPVGSFAANAFGLHDMHGNVWEWVEDCYVGNYDGALTDGSARTAADCFSRVLRGGSWSDDPRLLRSAARFRYFSANRLLNLGFRVGRSLTQ